MSLGQNYSGQNYSGQNTEKDTPNNHTWSWVPGMAQYRSGNTFHAIAGWLIIAACVALCLWNLSPRFQHGLFGIKLLWETPGGGGALNLVFTLASLFLAAAVANKLLFDARHLAALPDTRFARWATLLLCPRRGLTPCDHTQASTTTGKPSADSLLWTLAKLHFYAFTVIPLVPICLTYAILVPGLKGLILQMPHAITTAGFVWSANLLTAAGLLGVWLTVTAMSQLECSTATTGEQAADAGSTAQDAPHVTGKWRPVFLVSLGIAFMFGLVRLVMSGGPGNLGDAILGLPFWRMLTNAIDAGIDPATVGEGVTTGGFIVMSITLFAMPLLVLPAFLTWLLTTFAEVWIVVSVAATVLWFTRKNLAVTTWTRSRRFWAALFSPGVIEHHEGETRRAYARNSFHFVAIWFYGLWLVAAGLDRMFYTGPGSKLPSPGISSPIMLVTMLVLLILGVNIFRALRRSKTTQTPSHMTPPQVGESPQ